MVIHRFPFTLALAKSFVIVILKSDSLVIAVPDWKKDFAKEWVGYVISLANITIAKESLFGITIAKDSVNGPLNESNTSTSHHIEVSA